MDKGKIALALYSVKPELKKDLEGTLQKVADVGYDAVQMSGFNMLDYSPEYLKKLFDKMGFSIAGGQVEYNEDGLFDEKFVRYNDALNYKYLFLPGIPRESRDKPDAFKKTADLLNEAAVKYKKHGIIMGYHNHHFEFADLGAGVRGFDILLEEIDWNLVVFEPDIYWIKKAGENIKEILSKLEGRCPVMHIKDMEAGEEGFFTEVGEGIINLKGIFDMDIFLGTEWFVIEQDKTRKTPIESIKISYDNLKKMHMI